MTPRIVHSDGLTEAWQGDCLDAAQVDAVVGTRTLDALIFDAPYSTKTHDSLFTAGGGL